MGPPGSGHWILRPAAMLFGNLTGIGNARRLSEAGRCRRLSSRRVFRIRLPAFKETLHECRQRPDRLAGVSSGSSSCATDCATAGCVAADALTPSCAGGHLWVRTGVRSAAYEVGDQCVQRPNAAVGPRSRNERSAPVHGRSPSGRASCTTVCATAGCVAADALAPIRRGAPGREWPKKRRIRRKKTRLGMGVIVPGEPRMKSAACAFIGRLWRRPRQPATNGLVPVGRQDHRHVQRTVVQAVASWLTH